jgi:tRNA threonylcarbamoyladenosine biosynthesis protein TsaB
MKNLLYIETSTKNCSVAISSDYNLIAFKELNSENYSHSENLHVFINDILEQAKIDINDLNGVVIGKGPGSYTGLRIGTACAKGLCYSLEVPLISINSLEIMAERISPISNQLLIPMIDARREEVYTMILDHNKKVIKNTWAEVLNVDSFLKYSNDKDCVFFGSGSMKFKSINPKGKNIFLVEECFPSAKDMIMKGYDLFNKKKFESVAYYEPFYLKEFVSSN